MINQQVHGFLPQDRRDYAGTGASYPTVGGVGLLILP